MSNFEGKVVIVTGAAGGIGRAAAIKFASSGASVVLVDVNEQGLCETARSVGDRALIHPTDVGNANACTVMVNQAVRHFGRLDVLFNNAAISGARNLTGDMPIDDWMQVINVTLNSVFFCTRAAIPHMQKSGAGVIINTTSVDGLVGMASLPHYSAAKHGVVGFTKTVALEYGPQNIRAVAVAPGYVRTPMAENELSDEERAGLIAMTPLHRCAEPEELAEVVVWLASDQASFVTGVVQQADGGILAGFGSTG